MLERLVAMETNVEEMQATVLDEEIANSAVVSTLQKVVHTNVDD